MDCGGDVADGPTTGVRFAEKETGEELVASGMLSAYLTPTIREVH